ncbi:MAG TPA: hypothetical protein VG273_18740 [Bryobacteraceae bacterium]|jgi:hypothetical protein|nr:hypothetical protein [Bryobacteraceae bacterium]
MPGKPQFQKQLESVEQMLGRIDAAANPDLRATVQELVQAIMNLHGEGIERVLELLRAAGESGDALIQRMGRDELVGSLLVLYGLHPVDIEGRIHQALDKVRGPLRGRSAEAELIGIEDGTVRLRLHATGHGCGSEASNPHGSNLDDLKEMLEEAIYRAAPDATVIIAESTQATGSFVPLEMLVGAAPAGAKAGP